ncbi:MAG: RNA polymerase sigma factor [Planctomycetota bacterium]
MEATTEKRTDFARLVSTHHRAVWRYLRLLGCEATMADDLTQETFLRLLRQPIEGLTREHAEGYLRRVAKHVFIDECRRRRREVPCDLHEADLVWDEAARDDGGETWRRALRDCLSRVSPRPRLVLALRYHEQLSIARVAERMKMKESGVKSILQRVKERLRECIERRLESS